MEFELRTSYHTHLDNDSRWPKSFKNYDPSDKSTFWRFEKGDPKSTILNAYKNGLDSIFVTNQNSFGYSKKVYDTIKDLKNKGQIGKDFEVYEGEEVLTSSGEILVLGHQQTIGPCEDVYEALDKARYQEGYVIVPHPFLYLKTMLKEETPMTVDDLLFEKGFNSRIHAIEELNGELLATEKMVLSTHIAKPVFKRMENLLTRMYIQNIKLKDPRLDSIPRVANDDNHEETGVGHVYTMYDHDPRKALESGNVKIKKKEKYDLPGSFSIWTNFIYYM